MSLGCRSVEKGSGWGETKTNGRGVDMSGASSLSLSRSRARHGYYTRGSKRFEKRGVAEREEEEEEEEEDVVGPSVQRPLSSVIKAALVSRLVTVALCAAFDSLLDDFDTSAHLAFPTCFTDLSSSSARGETERANVTSWGIDTDVGGGGEFVTERESGYGGALAGAIAQALARWVRGAVVWDGVHFVRICQCGYEFDHHIAFLPLWPLAMRTVAKWVVTPLIAFLERVSSSAFQASSTSGFQLQIGDAFGCALSGIILSNAFFVLSSVSLFRLGKRLGLSDSLAFRACLLYACNPATVFYSAIYTESMYNFLHFEALVHLFKERESLFSVSFSTVLMAAATFTRSNGILTCVIVLASRLRHCLRACLRKISSRGGYRRGGGSHVVIFRCEGKELNQFLKQIGMAAIQCLAIVAPFYLYQVSFQVSWCQSYQRGMTSLSQDAREEALDEMGSSWCKGSPYLPKVYQSIQAKYWDVGLFRFYKLSQLPNFLLAFPIWLCTSFEVYQSVKSSLFPDPRALVQLHTLVNNSKAFGQLVLCLHWMLMCLVSILIMNVQVSTRFLSTCAPLYFVTSKMTSEKER